MQRSGRQNDWCRKTRVLAVASLSALVLNGCSSIADAPLIGVPASAPPRPEVAGSYLPVHDLPPRRQEETLSSAEQTRIEKELSDIRARQKQTAATDAAAVAASSKRMVKKRPATQSEK